MRGDLELAVEDFLEEVALATRAPFLELGVAVAGQPDHDERGADVHLDVVDRLAAAPVEAVGDAQECSQLSQSLFAAGPERAELLRRARFASPVPASERREQ